MKKIYKQVLFASLLVIITKANAQITYSFNTCGATGRLGPTQSQVNVSYTSGNSLYNNVTINTQGIQEWTVPQTGTYTIELAGAGGGDAGSFGGGGRKIKGEVYFTAGTELKIVVGQKGKNIGCNSTTHSSGGGGGSFVVAASGNTPILIAGGGAGFHLPNLTSIFSISDGSYSSSGNNSFDGTGTGGTSGNGGTGSNNGWGAGGGGFFTDGTPGFYDASWGFDGKGFSFLNGAIGGRSMASSSIYPNTGWNADGGFGGGGGAHGCTGGGGGGGGYSGGGGCNQNVSQNTGGGGGSFIAGSVSNASDEGLNINDGYVNFTLASYIITGIINPLAICSGSVATVPYTASGTYTSNNTFIAKLSDANGDFTNSTDIGSIMSTTSGTINTVIPANIAYGTGYRIRVVSSDPLVIGSDNGSDLTLGDNEDPTFTCPSNQNVDLNNNCQLIVPDLVTGLTGNDNCGTVTFTQSPAASDALASSHNQTHTLTITADDGNGNSSTCDVTLTGKDVTKPTFTCPSNQNVNLNGSCQLIVPDLISELTGNDNCGTVTFIQNPVSGTVLSSSHGSTHNIVITADDGNGNTEECTAVLTGKDVTKPTFTCPGNSDVNLNGSCQLIVPDLITGLTGNDNCGTVTFTQNPVAGAILSSSHGSTHNVVITADDGNGNTEECTVVLTSKDVIKPTFSCPENDDVDLNGSCQLIVSDLIAELTGSDNCGTVTFTQTPEAGTALSSSHNEQHNVVITADDDNGNTEECTVVLTGKDVTKPTFTCPVNDDVDLNSNCNLVVPDLIISLTGNDNCGTVTFTQNPVAGTTLSSSHGSTHNVVITADDGNGNTEECTVVLTGKDETKPTFTCPGNRNVDLNSNCQLAVPDLTGELTGNDNCGTVTFTQNPVAGATLSSSHGSTHNVVITADDGNGNTEECTVVLTGKDVTKPTFICPSNQNVNLNGSCQLIVPDLISELIGNDNCGTVTFTQNPQAGTTLSSSHNQNHDVVITADDGNGNTEECIVMLTGKDIIPPSITCSPNVTVPLDFNATAASNVNLGSPNYGDNCSGSSVSNNAPLTYSLGSTTVTWTVTDAASLIASCTQTVTVNKRQTVIEYIGGLMNQYSDTVHLKAKLTDKLTGNPLSGKLITFTLGSQTETAITDASGIAFKVMNLLQAPNTYNVKACFDGITDATYKSACDNDQNYLIKCEDAKVEYTGVTFVNTTCATCSKAVILMSASVRDISAVDVNDPYPGDISKAFITFTVKDINGSVKFTQTLPVSLIDPNDKTNGFASTSYQGDCGADPGASFTVELSVSGYYCGSDQSVVTIAKPLNEFITGGGWVRPVPNLSAGTFKSSDNTKTNFGFNVKYNKSVKNLQGNVNIIFRRLECDGIWHVYQIKSTAMGTLTVNTSNLANQTALFTSKAVLKDVTYPTSAYSIGGANLQMTVTDKGEPGNNDMIGITLTAGSATTSPCGTTINNGAMLFSSNWSVTKTTEVKLGGGNIVIHGTASNTAQAITMARNNQKPTNEIATEVFDVKISPNPTENEFHLQVISNSGKDVMIRVSDVLGRQVKLLKAQPGQSIRFGHEFKQGLYLVEVRQGENRQTVKVFKQ